MRKAKVAVHYFGASLWILSIFVFLFNGNPAVQLWYKIVACIMFLTMAGIMITKGHEKDTTKEGGIIFRPTCEVCYRGDQPLSEEYNGYRICTKCANKLDGMD